MTLAFPAAISYFVVRDIYVCALLPLCGEE